MVVLRRLSRPVHVPTTAVAAPFVDPLTDNFTTGTERQRVARHLPGALLAHQRVAVQIPLLIGPTLLVLAVSVTASLLTRPSETSERILIGGAGPSERVK